MKITLRDIGLDSEAIIERDSLVGNIKKFVKMLAEQWSAWTKKEKQDATSTGKMLERMAADFGVDWEFLTPDEDGFAVPEVPSSEVAEVIEQLQTNAREFQAQLEDAWKLVENRDMLREIGNGISDNLAELGVTWKPAFPKPSKPPAKAKTPAKAKAPAKAKTDEDKDKTKADKLTKGIRDLRDIRDLTRSEIDLLFRIYVSPNSKPPQKGAKRANINKRVAKALDVPTHLKGLCGNGSKGSESMTVTIPKGTKAKIRKKYGKKYGTGVISAVIRRGLSSLDDDIINQTCVDYMRETGRI